MSWFEWSRLIVCDTVRSTWTVYVPRFCAPPCIRRPGLDACLLQFITVTYCFIWNAAVISVVRGGGAAGAFLSLELATLASHPNPAASTPWRRHWQLQGVMVTAWEWIHCSVYSVRTVLKMTTAGDTHAVWFVPPSRVMMMPLVLYFVIYVRVMLIVLFSKFCSSCAFHRGILVSRRPISHRHDQLIPKYEFLR